MSTGIGWHLSEALDFASEAAVVHERGWTYPSDPHAEARMAGMAAGHAFRAAELAYDLGQKHGRASARPPAIDGAIEALYVLRDAAMDVDMSGSRVFWIAYDRLKAALYRIGST